MLDRGVAVKLMAEQLAADETAVRRFKREARAAARLSEHANVVTIYDVGQSPPTPGLPSGRPFIVMERLSGGTVADALRAAPVRPVRAMRWLGEAAAAIDFAHSRGVVHRDIKPSNLLLDEARVLHVGDFGIALVATEDTVTATGQLLGTAAYLAPEIALGQPGTEASDRYALAVAAFELLTGERPFTARHFAAQARQHIEEPPPPASPRNPRLPRAVDAVLAKGMSKRPEDRFASAGELVAALDAALAEGNHRPAELDDAPRTIRMRRPPPPVVSASRRRPSRALALGGLVALILGVGIAAAMAGGGRPAASGVVAATGSAVSRTAAKAMPSRAPVPTPVAAVTQSADALEAQGHRLMLAGDYSRAIPLLRQAVATAPRNSLTYAYALYDLGRSLRLSGDPRAAIPILEQRLKIPNQTGVVRAELALAKTAAGGGGPQPGPAGEAPPRPAGPKHNHGHGGDGGD